MRGKERLEPGDAALLGLAAEDPEYVACEGSERGGGAVGVGGLAVVDEEDVAHAADILQAMRQAGKRRERGRHLARQKLRTRAQRWPRARSGCCAGRAAADAGEVGEGAERAGPRRAGDELRCRRRTSHGPRARVADQRDRPVLRWAAAAARRCRAHQRRPRRRRAARALDQPCLHRRVVLDRAVPIEVIGRDVEQHADGGRQRSASARSGTTTSRSRESDPAPAAPAPGSPCRCCRPSARRGRRSRSSG